MLTVRFARVGKNKRAQFKIVLQEHTVAPGGRHVEILGSYDPHLKRAVLREERIKYWISEGVQFSDSVYNLMVTKGLISGDKRKVKLPEKKAEEKKEEGGAEAQKDGEEKPAEEKKEADSTNSPQETLKEPARNVSHNDAGGEKPAEPASTDAKQGGEKKEEPKA